MLLQKDCRMNSMKIILNSIQILLNMVVLFLHH
nr:MAG TPA: hypothetical protein [Crassvirales sp.]